MSIRKWVTLSAGLLTLGGVSYGVHSHLSSRPVETAKPVMPSLADSTVAVTEPPAPPDSVVMARAIPTPAPTMAVTMPAPAATPMPTPEPVPARPTVTAPVTPPAPTNAVAQATPQANKKPTTPPHNPPAMHAKAPHHAPTAHKGSTSPTIKKLSSESV